MTANGPMSSEEPFVAVHMGFTLVEVTSYSRMFRKAVGNYWLQYRITINREGPFEWILWISKIPTDTPARPQSGPGYNFLQAPTVLTYEDGIRTISFDPRTAIEYPLINLSSR